MIAQILYKTYTSFHYLLWLHTKQFTVQISHICVHFEGVCWLLKSACLLFLPSDCSCWLLLFRFFYFCLSHYKFATLSKSTNQYFLKFMRVVLLSGSASSQLLFIFDRLPPHLIHPIAFGHNKGEVIMATITDLKLMSFTVWIIITAVVLYIRKMALEHNKGTNYSQNCRWLSMH